MKLLSINYLKTRRCSFWLIWNREPTGRSCNINISRSIHVNATIKVLSKTFNGGFIYKAYASISWNRKPSTGCYIDISRSINVYAVIKKKDYFHLFDYYRWDEEEVKNTIINNYNWETAIDTDATWRIGDGTAAFYNYIYYSLSGFTEFDTFRSNQIREGDLSRDDALRLVEKENQPRFASIEHFLELIGLDFNDTIKKINSKKI